MKSLVIPFLFLISANAFADKDYGYPCFGKTKNDCAVLVEEDYNTGEIFDSGNGACKALGHPGISWSQANNGEEGPYIVVDSNGKVIQKFPKDPASIYRFSVITHLVCRD